MKIYDVDVTVHRISADRLLTSYYNRDPEGERCRGCPHYGRVWSCPPGLPSADQFLKPYKNGFLIGVKVIYSDEARSLALNQEKTSEIRRIGYEKVARELLLTILEAERFIPGSVCMGAGRCILCRRCARLDGESCRHPDKLRYSVTGFGFDFMRMAKEELGITLLWSRNGLPEYDAAIAALFYS